MFKISKPMLVGAISSLVIILISALLLVFDVIDDKIFYFILGISFIVMGLPFFFHLLFESNREKNMEEMFIEFSRDLAEGVKSGTPVNKTIINVKNKDYGVLNENILKLSNQIALGIPVREALYIFSSDVGSSTINRAISMIIEAERSGGKIEAVLESVAYSISQIERLKKERRAAIYNLTVQGYIIFFIFVIIMLVMQFKILPITQTLGSDMAVGQGEDISSFSGGVNLQAFSISAEDFAKPFLFLLLVQGFFIGLIIGKISEGDIKSGLKHSFILLTISWIISSGANAFLT